MLRERILYRQELICTILRVTRDLTIFQQLNNGNKLDINFQRSHLAQQIKRRLFCAPHFSIMKEC